MLKKTITFDDIDGNPVTEDFYFNITRTDLMELLIEKPELEDKLQDMAKTMDGKSIMGIVKEFILLSVGKREEGGRKFIKNQNILDDFRYSGAYDSLFWELVNDPNRANDFMEGVIPKGLMEDIEARGGVEALRAQAAGETVVNLPDKDWAAVPVQDHPLAQNDQITELPDSGRIVEGEVVPDPRSVFPNSLPEAINAQGSNAEDKRPAWLREGREPTRQELIAMSKDEMLLVFKLKEEGKLHVAE